jgi:phosphotriesterase-related protein
MGRDLEFVRQASMKSGVPVVAGAGFYSQPFYPKEISTMSEEQVLQALLRQVDADPIGAFGEIGSWDEITADERKVFRAVGRAHVATNIPIFTHTGIPGKSALEQLDILEDAGVRPDRVVIGHLGNLVDPNVYVQKAICRRGAYVGFDRQGGNNDAQQVPMVMALVEAGFVDHLMFSSDASRGYSKTLTVFLPKLKAAGASDEILHKIMVDNPRRFLAFVPKKPRKKIAAYGFGRWIISTRLPAGSTAIPITIPVFRNGRGSPSSEPPAALSAATVAVMSVVFTITWAIGSLAASESRCMMTIGGLRFAFAVSTVAPKFRNSSGPAGVSIRLTSCIPNADW